jgi:predicted ATPase
MTPRIRKVVIRNFKRFGDETVFELPGHVVLVGPNNSGKTTFLQAVATWAFTYNYWRKRTPDTNPRNGFTKVPIARQAFASVPLRAFDALWTERSSSRPIEIEVHADWELPNHPITMEIWSDTSEQVYVRPKWIQVGIVLDLLNIPQVVYVPPMTGLSVDEPVYQPPYIEQRLAQGRPGEVIRNLLLQASHDEATWRDLTGAIKRLFDYNLITPDDSGPEIIADYRQGEGKPRFDIASAGSGFQQVLMLMTFLTTRRGTVLLVDEPDAHLHVILQNSIYQELKRFAAARDSQLVLATHSEVIVNSVDPSEILMLIHEPKPLVDKVQRQQLTNALRVLPNSDIMLARLAPGILYLEGHTDLSILKEWARILDHPVRKLFDSPNFLWRPTVWEVADGVAGIKSRQHYEALQLVQPTLRALEILDGDSAGQQQATPITGEGYQKLRWHRYEVESYLFHPASLERLVGMLVGPAGVAALRDHLTANMPPRFLLSPLDDLPMLNTTKARVDLLPPALAVAGLAELPYTEYFRIAAVMTPEEIHPEVREKLDGICQAFSLPSQVVSNV